MSRSPTRGEHDRLKAECALLRADIQELRIVVQRQSHDLRIQFERIAQMQAILDEERWANTAGTLPPTKPKTAIRP